METQIIINFIGEKKIVVTIGVLEFRLQLDMVQAYDPALRRWGLKNQKSKVILSYI